MGFTALIKKTKYIYNLSTGLYMLDGAEQTAVNIVWATLLYFFVRYAISFFSSAAAYV